MKNTSFNCPNCTAPLEFVPGKQAMFCPYCGAKIVKDDIDFYKEDSKNARIETVSDSILKAVGTKEQRAEIKRRKEEDRRKAAAENQKGSIPLLIFIVALFGVLFAIEHFGLL